MTARDAERELVSRIRAGEELAWQQCIAEYEGRLQAFVFSRLKDRSLSEDLVQETFLGFLTALPNFDDRTPVESFLFAIAAHKITDELRRQGRRPALPLNVRDDSVPNFEPAGSGRLASSIARSREQRGREETAIADCLRALIEQWKEKAEWQRLKCAELLFVKGYANKEVARLLVISEQDVANHKSFIVSKLKDRARKLLPADVDLDDWGLGEEAQ